MAFFSNLKYELDNGGVGLTRVRNDFVTFYGTPPAGAFTEQAKVYSTKGTRKFGLRARFVTYSRQIVSGQDAITRYIKIKKATLTAWDAAPPTVDHGGFTWDFHSRTGEDTN